MKDKLINLLKVIVTVALLAVVAFTVDLRQVWRVFATIRWTAILLALAIYQIGILVRAYRWQALLDGQDVHVPLRSLTYLYYVGTFFNSFLPSGFGGDFVKMYELARYGASGALAVSTVLVDRLMGLLVLFAMAIIALPFSWHLVPRSIAFALLAIIAVFTFFLWLFMNRRLMNWLAARIGLLRKVLAHEKVATFYGSFHRYSRASLVRAGAASVGFNLSLIIVQVYLARAVDVNISLGYFLIFVPIISSLLALPISISGFGVREGGYVLLFGQAGVASDRAVAMSLLFYILNMITGLVGGSLYLWQGVRGYLHHRPA
jgi:glycosyltransferase 2 family protein